MKQPGKFDGQFTALDPADWDLAKAAHLARRAGFGVNRAGHEHLLKLGLAGALDAFCTLPEAEEELEQSMAALGGELAVRGELNISSYDMVERLREWWLYRLVHTRQPLRERLCIVWHGHFAVQASKVVRDPLLLQQNEVFRRLGAASFRDLLIAVARDPAMLVYLDNRLSQRGHPNENWARELLELFTLGIDQYTQADVVALARIFTGWTTPDERSSEFLFDPRMHDEQDKEFLGQKIRGRSGADGYLEGLEALELILAHPACARRIAAKLLAVFAEPTSEPAVVAALAEVLVRENWSLSATLRVLFGSQWFYAGERRFALYKSPLEWLVSAARLLGLQNVHRGPFLRYLRLMGMQLFEPPSVAGWESGAAWHNSGSALQRLELALAFAELAHSARPVLGSPALDYDALAEGGTRPEEWLQCLSDRLWQCPLSAVQRQAILDALAQYAADEPSSPPAKARRRSLRNLVHCLLAAPAFALA